MSNSEADDDLLALYRMAALKHGKATCEGDSQEANQSHTQLHQILRNLVDNGNDHRLVELFTDANLWVQIWSSTHSLKNYEKEAVAKLESISRAEVPLISMTARYTLQEWRNGSLATDI